MTDIIDLDGRTVDEVSDYVQDLKGSVLFDDLITLYNDEAIAHFISGVAYLELAAQAFKLAGLKEKS